MSAISKLDALNAVAIGKLVGFSYTDQPDVEVVINKSWSIEQILSLDCCDLYIKIDEVNLNGFVFLKPFSLEELVENQEVFLIGNTGRIVRGKFTSEYDDLVLAVKNGSVQRDVKNAELQALAIQSVLGVQNELEFIEMDFKALMNASVKPKRNTKKKEESSVEPKQADKHVADVSIHAQLDFLLVTLRKCTTIAEIDAVLRDVETVGFNAKQMLEITMLKEKLIADIQDVVVEKTETPEEKAERINQANYEQLLSDLIDRANKSNSPAEANALYKYTTQWTEAQRKPLMDVITKRLQELNPPEKSESSLMVRIQEAKTTIDLQKLEIEVESCDPLIQERLLNFVNQRRTELYENIDLPWDEVETDPVKIIQEFKTKISTMNAVDDVLSIRHVFLANGHLEQSHHAELIRFTEDKLLELDPVQYAPKPINIDHQIYIDGINACISEDEVKATLQDVNDQGFNEEQLSEIQIAEQCKLSEFALGLNEPDLTTFDESVEYQTLLNDLINRAQEAKTPAEATALTGYTKAWSEIQRKPLIDAIHKRLIELNPETSTVAETPSLMVQIQTAPDLTALDALEIDVAGRHPDIQPRLMGYVRARRYELENSGSKVVPS